MSATGLNPFEEYFAGTRVKVPWDRLEEFDRLMAQGGIEAVVEALKKEQEGR